jgi:hypothetical protein
MGRRSESGFLSGVRRDWPHLFPRLPCQSEASRRTRWLRGAFIQFWRMLAGQEPDDDCQQADTTAIPVRHPSRVRGGGDQRAGPGSDLPARSGWDAAHAEWLYGYRLAINTDLGSRIVRARSIVPAAVSEREVAIGLLPGGPIPADLPADKGFNGKVYTAGAFSPGPQQSSRPTRSSAPASPTHNNPHNAPK